MASSNPALNDDIFKRETAAGRAGSFNPGWGSPANEVPAGLFSGAGGATDTTGSPPQTGGPISGDTMRLGGTLSAAAILLGILVVAGGVAWQSVEVVTQRNPLTGETVVTSGLPGWIIIAALAGFGIGILTVFKPKLARITGPVYAVLLGSVAGAISHFYEVQFSGIVLQALGLTVGVFVMMLVLYATRTIRVTDKLRSGIFAATGAVALVYLVSIVLGLFGTQVPMIHESGPVGILFSRAVVVIASMNLLVDFDMIERGVTMGAPRYMEWYGAFGLMVTLVWLYLELLRLLSKLRSR